MNDIIMLGLLVLAGFIGTIAAAPALAQALENFLIIEKAEMVS
jgi:hypothetical protein